METLRIKVGEKVRVEGYKFPGIWTITKVNQVNVKLEQQDNGIPRRLNCSKTFLLPVEGNPSDPRATVTADSVTMSRTLPTVHGGSFVRYTGPSGKVKTGTLFVVLVDKWDKVNIALPGGDGGRYWRMLPRHLAVVDPSEVLKEGV